MSRRIVVLLLLLTAPLGACDPPPAGVTRPLEGAPPVAHETAQGQWLSNYRVTDMWSGPADQPGALSFGTTSRPFCVFQERDQRGERLYVFNPYSANYFWIDRTAVGPVAEPDVRPRSAKPANQNCADAVFDG